MPVVMAGREYRHGYECRATGATRLCDPSEMAQPVVGYRRRVAGMAR